MARRPGVGPDDVDADLITEPLDAAPDAAPVALTTELDLHHFLPRECADVVAEYLDAARAAGFPAVRLIHGKGTGALRRTVHAVLARHPAVVAYRLADDRGGWGATLVDLAPPDPA
jgi:dsDNA-specific endonuclease/ATPase MutS2